MLFWIYNALLILALPFLAIQFSLRALIYKKRSFSSYFLPHIPKRSPHLKRLWIHAVSLGEVNTASNFIHSFAKRFAGYEIYISTMTETGFKAASSIKNVKVCYLPLDAAFIQKQVIKAIDPTYFIGIEGDVWPSLAHLLHKQGVKQVLLSAKISQKSQQRLQKFKAIASFLYGPIDFIYAQDSLMKGRFETLGVEANKVVVSGNLKYGKPLFPPISALAIKRLDNFLCLNPVKKTVVISCTHENEELLLLHALKSLCSQVNMIMMPRHPARCSFLYQELVEKGYKVSMYSNNKSTQDDIFLIDETGVVSFIYKKADLVILGGSFVQHIGGHNLLEPVYCSCPVIVGPYMEKQVGLLKLMHEYRLGIQTSLTHLAHSVNEILTDPEYKKRLELFINLNQDPASELIEQISADLNIF